MKKVLKLFKFFYLKAFVLIFHHLFFSLFKKINPKGFLLINIYDYKMMIPLQYDGIGRALYVYRSRELDHKWMTDNELLTGNIVLDLGVNIGYYAIMEAKKIGEFWSNLWNRTRSQKYRIFKQNINLNKIDNIFDLNKVPFLTKMENQNLYYHLKLT